MMLAASILAKVTLTTAIALASTQLSRGSRAAVRHVLLAAAFVVLLVLPIASVVAPSITVAVPTGLPAEIASVPVDAFVDVTPSDASGGAGVVGRSALARPVLSWAAVTAAVWIAGAIAFLLPVGVGLAQMRSLRRSGLPWRRGQSVVDALAADGRVQRRIRRIDVLVHESVLGPMTCGVVRPAILLPLDAQNWKEEDLHRAVVHELEHVRRADWGSQCLARGVCALYWFHPLVWIAQRELSLEAERACDDAVLRRTDATAYADQLVVLAERLSAAANPPVLAMTNRDDLGARVRAVLDSRQQRGRAGTRLVALVASMSALLIAAMSPIRIVATSQSPQASETVQAKKFDVVSIRPCQPTAQPDPGRGRGRGGGSGGNVTTSPGRFSVECMNLEQLVYLAYAGRGATDSERLVNDPTGQGSNATKVRGGPAWVHADSDRFAIEATGDAAADRRTLQGPMLRALLEERFRLKIHRKVEQVPMYSLAVAKGGFKLQPMKETDCDPDRNRSPFDPGEKPKCGLMSRMGNRTNMIWTFVGFGLSSLANQLATVMDRNVIDRTGISGEFIIRIEFLVDDNTPGQMRRLQGEAAEPGPTIFAALEQQLGLKLETVRAPRGFIVIDHAERPEQR